MPRKLLIIVLAAFAANAQAQKFTELAKTPPMGWNSWNKFQCNVSEMLIRETADAMVASGMREASNRRCSHIDSRPLACHWRPSRRRFRG